jgi:hypothetical protein
LIQAKVIIGWCNHQVEVLREWVIHMLSPHRFLISVKGKGAWMVKKSGRHHLSQITEEMTASQVLAPEQFMPFSRTFGASFNAGMETKQNQQGSPYAKNM